jgi:hypothetical protein
MKWTIVLALVLSVAIGSCAGPQQAIVGTGSYQVLDLGVHPGFDTSEPSGINSVGQVLGFSIRDKRLIPARVLLRYTALPENRCGRRGPAASFIGRDGHQRLRHGCRLLPAL